MSEIKVDDRFFFLQQILEDNSNNMIFFYENLEIVILLLWSSIKRNVILRVEGYRYDSRPNHVKY